MSYTRREYSCPVSGDLATFVDAWDRLQNRLELLAARSDRPSPAADARPLATVLVEAGEALGRDVAALADEPQLAQVRAASQHAAGVAWAKVYDASGALAVLCYVCSRALGATTAVETGVANGVTTAHLLAGLAPSGTLHSIDWAPGDARRRRPVGEAVPTELRRAWQLELGPSRRLLPRIARRVAPIGVFVHDSLHTYRTMRRELDAVTPHMDRPSVVLVDDVANNAAFYDWSEAARPGYVATVATEIPDHPIGIALLL